MAQADLGRIAARVARDYPQTNDKVGAWIIPLHEQITGSTKPALVALSCAVGFVLLIGCVNLANLLLVRGATRGREIGVRVALGAGRGRVIRQLLTENALLAFGGGLAGIALGVAGSRALASLVPDSVRQVQDIRVDGGVLLFAVALTVLSALVFGLVPALHAVRPGLMTSLRTGAGQTGRRDNALRSALVVTQLSLAVVLLVGAGLLLRSFLVMQRVDLGYRTDGVYLTGVTFGRVRYPDALARCRLDRGRARAIARESGRARGGGDGSAAHDWRRPGHHGDSRWRYAGGRPTAVDLVSVRDARVFVLDANAIGCGTHIHRGRPKGCAARGNHQRGGGAQILAWRESRRPSVGERSRCQSTEDYDRRRAGVGASRRRKPALQDRALSALRAVPVARSDVDSSAVARPRVADIRRSTNAARRRSTASGISARAACGAGRKCSRAPTSLRDTGWTLRRRGVVACRAGRLRRHGVCGRATPARDRCSPRVGRGARGNSPHGARRGRPTGVRRPRPWIGRRAAGRSTDRQAAVRCQPLRRADADRGARGARCGDGGRVVVAGAARDASRSGSSDSRGVASASPRRADP